MKKTLTLLTLILLTACTTSPKIKQNQVSLENKQWEPVNTNYINKKDF